MRLKPARPTASVVAILATVIVFAILFALTLWLTSGKENTSRENGLYQFIFLAVGVAASFVFGRQSARAAATDVVRPVAKGAVRRLANLAAGLGSLGGAVNVQRAYMQERADDNDGAVSLAEVGQAQDMLQIQINAQLNTVADAIEDWREFVPDEVAAVEHQGASQ
jgi:hypothetical protein